MADIIVWAFIFVIFVIMPIFCWYMLWFKPDLWVDLQMIRPRLRAMISPLIKYEDYRESALTRRMFEWSLWPLRIILTLYLVVVVMVVAGFLWAAFWRLWRLFF